LRVCRFADACVKAVKEEAFLSAKISEAVLRPVKLAALEAKEIDFRIVVPVGWSGKFEGVPEKITLDVAVGTPAVQLLDVAHALLVAPDQVVCP